MVIEVRIVRSFVGRGPIAREELSGRLQRCIDILYKIRPAIHLRFVYLTPCNTPQKFFSYNTAYNQILNVMMQTRGQQTSGCSCVPIKIYKDFGEDCLNLAVAGID